MAQEYRRKATSVSLINYHFVWCPKYRRQVLGDAVKARLEALIRDVLAELHCEALALEVMADHVHLLVNCPPTLAPCQIIFRVKGRSSRVLRREFPHLRRLPSLWTRSYFVATAGNVSADTIRHYIEMQNRRERV
ncbi:MAG TPA: IS200/IS605 family transposase [Chloroflexi bacterium]|nr:IS200/IS605 family transposase [Chloroflexota bacterium]